MWAPPQPRCTISSQPASICSSQSALNLLYFRVIICGDITMFQTCHLDGWGPLSSGCCTTFTATTASTTSSSLFIFPNMHLRRCFCGSVNPLCSVVTLIYESSDFNDDESELQQVVTEDLWIRSETQGWMLSIFWIGGKKDVNGNREAEVVFLLVGQKNRRNVQEQLDRRTSSLKPSMVLGGSLVENHTRPSHLSLLFFTQSVSMLRETFPPRVLIWAVKRHWIISNPKCHLQSPDSSQVWIAIGSNLGWKFRWSLFGLRLLRPPVLTMCTDAQLDACLVKHELGGRLFFGLGSSVFYRRPWCTAQSPRNPSNHVLQHPPVWLKRICSSL